MLSRGVLNTRMRDFYDIHMLLGIYEKDINVDILRNAYNATAYKRQTNVLLNSSQRILQDVEESSEVFNHWERYRKKYKYAGDISFEEVIESCKNLCSKII